MPRRSPNPEIKSAERLAFEHFLRTGRRLIRTEAPERKFNPYHDPRNGQFTFAPGGPNSVADPIFSDRRGLWQPKPASSPKSADDPANRQSTPEDLLERLRPDNAQPSRFQLATRGGRGPRRGRGQGGGRRTDPSLLEQIFPGLRDSPAGAIIRMADGALELTSAAEAATQEIHRARVRSLVADIQSIDADYEYRSLAPVRTLQGQVNEINKLRSDRAMALYRIRGDERELQVYVARFIQARVDAAYQEGAVLYDSGKLPKGRSRNQAIGSYVDLRVRADMQEYFNSYNIDYTQGPLRVIGRQYNTSRSDPTYVVPDARIEFGDYDWTLEPKRPGKKQIRGNFNSDLDPDWTMIIRPSQLGRGHTYLIKSPRQ